MFKKFSFKAILDDRDALVARIELAYALKRRPLLVAPPPVTTAEADKEKDR